VSDLPARVLVLGLARSGRAAVAALRAADVEVLAYDTAQEIDSQGVDAAVHLGAWNHTLLEGVGLVVKSPGVTAGAPPVVPHQVEEAEGGGKACLSCHRDGGWAPRFGAYAPVVPHPELTSCRQCHVPRAAADTFRATTWETVTSPAIDRAAMPGSPPPIPHGLQMRENCRACHAGPGAVDVLRTTHPQRVSCRQCHALAAPVRLRRWKAGGGRRRRAIGGESVVGHENPWARRDGGPCQTL